MSTPVPAATTSHQSSPPTPPAKIVPLGLLALVFSLAAAAAAGMALRSLHALIDHPAGYLTALLWVVAAACAIPIIPSIRALLAAAPRSRFAAEGDLVEARKVSARGREHAAISMGYALAVVLVAMLVAFATANDGAVADTFLQGRLIKESWWDVTRAFWVNVRVAVGAQVFVLIFGLLLAIMRSLPGRAGRPLRWIAIMYIDIFRAIPSIIVIFLVGFGLSLAEVPFVRDLPDIWLAIFALTLTYSAYVAEVYRAGLESIHPSQWAASRSLGLSYGMTLRTVIVPQAVRRIIPPLLNDFIGLQKDTALIGVIGVMDAFIQSRLIASDFFNTTPVIVVAMLFIIITIPQARLVDRMILREQQRQAGRAA